MCAPSAIDRDDAGFSLLEAAVAAAILSLALAAFFAAGRNALHIAAATSRKTEAALDARSLIDRLGADIALKPGTFAGKTESGHTYRVVVTRVPNTKSELAAFDVVAEILENAGDQAPVVRVETFKLAEPRT